MKTSNQSINEAIGERERCLRMKAAGDAHTLRRLQESHRELLVACQLLCRQVERLAMYAFSDKTAGDMWLRQCGALKCAKDAIAKVPEMEHVEGMASYE